MKQNKPKVPAVQPKPAALNPRDRLSEHDIAELKATFDLFDEDHGGFIDPV